MKPGRKVLESERSGYIFWFECLLLGLSLTLPPCFHLYYREVCPFQWKLDNLMKMLRVEPRQGGPRMLLICNEARCVCVCTGGFRGGKGEAPAMGPPWVDHCFWCSTDDSKCS